MPLTTSTTFTCDRDGATADSGPTGSPNATPPAGWAQLFFSEQATSITGYLCPACAGAFKEFMGATLFAAKEGGTS